MNVLDENIPDSQRQLLRSWGIRVHQVGNEVGYQGIKDEDIIPFLHKSRGVTFFTRDLGFYRRHLCHTNYCLVCLAVGQYEAASFIRRFLRHSEFNTKTKRMGRVVRITHMELQIWQLNAEKEMALKWPL
ncbi:MAG: hypothetical protein KGI30_11495 [Planctomycetota bacterium]|nr:hypothetical protein [Planctomycetota bacterium]